MSLLNKYSNALIRRMQGWRCNYIYRLSPKPILNINKTYVSLFFDYEGKWSRPDEENNSRKGIEYILWQLDSVDIKATFNCVGRLVEDRLDMLQKIDQSGHEIASHTVEHTLVDGWSGEKMAADINKFRKLMSPISKNVIGFRAPQSKWSFKALKALMDAGILWDAANDQAAYPYIILQKENKRLWRMPVKLDDWNFEKHNSNPDKMFEGWCAAVVSAIKDKHYVAVGFHPWVLGKDDARLDAFSKFVNFLTGMENVAIRPFGDIASICEIRIESRK